MIEVWFAWILMYKNKITINHFDKNEQKTAKHANAYFTLTTEQAQ